jgi:hypothetical protein
MSHLASIFIFVCCTPFYLGCMEGVLDTTAPTNPNQDTATISLTDTATSPPTGLQDTQSFPGPDTQIQPPKDTFTPPPDVPGPCPSTPGAKSIGAECSEHCECGTNYCYDEAFMGITGTFRFCTKECGGDCGKPSDEEKEKGITEYKCLILAGNWTKPYNLTKSHICAPRCENVDSCKHLSSKYDACGNNKGWTDWCHPDDPTPHTLNAAVCLVSSEMPLCE